VRRAAAAAGGCVVGTALTLSALVLAIIAGIAVYFVLDAFGDRGPTYAAVSARDCLRARGYELRYHPARSRSEFARIELGPFDYSGVPGEATAILVFAPTPEAAEDAEWSDSERIPRRGNVLMPARPTDRGVLECLERSRAD
jgi:hypothetical protein